MLIKRSTGAAMRKVFHLLSVAFLAGLLTTAAAHAQEQYPELPEFIPPEEQTPPTVPEKQPNRPLVLITEVVTEPDPVLPGEPFVLKLKLKNYGNQPGGRIVATLQSLEGESTLKYFSPLGQSNTLHLGRLAVSAEKWLQCKLIAGPGVNGGIYNLVLHLSYVNEEGDPFESTAVTGLMLLSQGALELIELDYPASVPEGEIFPVSGYVVNSGGAPVRGVGLAVRPDDNFGAERGETYFGTFNEGDSDLFDFSIIALQPGKNTLKLELYYSDAMNRKEIIEKELQIEVIRVEQTIAPDDGSPPGTKGDTGGFWSGFKTFLCAFFGLGGS